MNNGNKSVFITWDQYNSRAESLANALNAEPVFIGRFRTRKTLLNTLSLYLSNTFKNIRVLHRTNPSIVIVTNTTWVVTLINFIYAKAKNTKLILDSHSCAFDHYFYKYPPFLSRWFAKHSALSLVTNQVHYELLRSIGANVEVVSDIPFEKAFQNAAKTALSAKFNICFVCSFSIDEPYWEVIRAASRLKDVKIFITGRYEKASINPDNYPEVSFTGFLDNNKYREVVSNAHAVLTLTKRENTMQRAGSEAVSAGKPLITSKTEMLKSYFKKGTVFVGNSADEICEGIEKLMKEYSAYAAEMKSFQEERKESFRLKIEGINKYLGVQ